MKFIRWIILDHWGIQTSKVRSPFFFSVERVHVSQLFAKQQAGANIVSSNMAGSNSGVNAMVEGRVNPQNCNKKTWHEEMETLGRRDRLKNFVRFSRVQFSFYRYDEWRCWFALRLNGRLHRWELSVWSILFFLSRETTEGLVDWSMTCTGWHCKDLELQHCHRSVAGQGQGVWSIKNPPKKSDTQKAQKCI